MLSFSVSNIQKCHICEVYIFASQVYNAGSFKMSHVDVRSKPGTMVPDPNRPRKTGSRYNNILSCVGKPKGSVTMSQQEMF